MLGSKTKDESYPQNCYLGLGNYNFFILDEIKPNALQMAKCYFH